MISPGLCACSEDARSNWGHRSEDGVIVCEFCDREYIGEKINMAATTVDYFDDLDIPLTLDPTKPQYKVVSQKDRFFSSKFNPALIERALNEYAQEGWELKGAVTADFSALGMSRNELIMFLEKKPQ